MQRFTYHRETAAPKPGQQNPNYVFRKYQGTLALAKKVSAADTFTVRGQFSRFQNLIITINFIYLHIGTLLALFIRTNTEGMKSCCYYSFLPLH